MARKLEVQIVGDASSLKRALGDAETHTSKFGSALGGVAKAGVLAAGAAGIGGLFVTLKAGIDDYRESAKVGAQTTAVIKSTGGAARVSAKDVGDLATSISNYSGVDDEAVQAGENMLLTFKNIRNETGKGNDIFNQSTAILTDMSVALGTDMNKSAIQLGKALNDPIAGISALSRVGVTFSDSQKATIKSLVDTGRTADAQKIILQELNSEFGGSAKAAGDTLPGQLSKLQNAFGNMSGELVGAAAPALTSFLGLVTDKGLPALGKLFDTISNAAGPVVASLVSAFQSAGPGIMEVLSSIGGVIKDDLLPIWQELAKIGGEAITKIGDVLRQEGPQIHTIFENLGGVIKDVASIAMPLIKFAFDTVLPTALKIAIPILELTTGAIKLIFDTLKWVADNIGGPLESIKGAFTDVKNWVSGRVSDIVTFFRDLPGNVKDAFVNAWDGIKGGITGAFDSIVTHVSGLPGRIAHEFAGIPAAIGAELKGKAGDLWDAVKHIFDKLPGFVKDALGIASPSKVFHGIGLAIMDGAIKGIEDKAGDLLSAAKGAFAKVGSAIGSVVEGHNLAPGVAMGGLVPQVMRALMFAREQGWHGTVRSGFRTYAEQAALYARYLAGGPLAAPPGHSSHEFGQAVDVTDYGTFGAIMSRAPLDARLYNRLGARDPVHYSVSGYAAGGVFNSPTLGVIGEAGPEAVIPLDRYGGFNSPTPIVVNVAGSVISERDLAVAIRDQLERHGDRNSGIGWTRPGA